MQKAGTVPSSGLATFYDLPIADQGENKFGIVSACEVPFSSTFEGTAVVATFEVANLHPETVRKMAQEGFVRIEAGYVGHPTRPPQTIFFGRLDDYNYRLSSGKIKWVFTASALPNEVWALKPNASQPMDRTGKPAPITVGEGVRILADRIGVGRANVRMPKIFDGDLSDTDIQARSDLTTQFSENFKNAVTLERWSTTKAAIDELNDLMKRVSRAVLETFGVVRNYSLLPDVNNPFRVVIEDVNLYTGESLNLDLDSEQIIDAGPAESTAATPATETAADAADDAGEAEAASTVVQVPEYQVVSVFDPKISMGLLVKGRSKKMGLATTFKVQKGKHTLNGSPLRWRTEYSGQQQVQAEVARGS